jgi:hypothetical protein|uniref:Uncharacterized protein n=1 Tax=Podoviridae sp. ctz6O13 TaxID=2827757 RepID=A0A8S5TKE8_9CAUD|nr:MAG TPA: hypothetical protein [Podoviridae sp. ctz6O13]
MSNSFRELNRLIEVTYENFNKVLDFIVASMKSCKEEQLPIVWDDSDYIADAMEDGEIYRYNVNAIRIPAKTDIYRQLEVHVTKIDGMECDKWMNIDTFDMDTILHMALYIQFPI